MDWKEWIGKRIFVKLNSGACYSGNVFDTSENENKIIMFIIDKYGKSVGFDVLEIEKIVEEEKDERNL